MIAALISLLSGGNGLFMGLGVALIAAISVYFKGSIDGGKLERAKEASKQARARDIAGEVDNDVDAMPPDQARERLRKWSR